MSDKWSIIHGDALKVLGEFSPGTFDAVITEPGGHILDPFAGSGTTVLVAVLEGYTATGIEVTDEYARRARERIAQELAQAA